MRETLTGVDAPRSFGYAITAITGPMAMLVDRIDGRWSFRPQGTGTGVTWGWTLLPKSALSAPVVPVLARICRGTQGVPWSPPGRSRARAANSWPRLMSSAARWKSRLRQAVRGTSMRMSGG